VNTQGNLLLLRKSNALKYYNCFQNFNKANLNINLLTKLDLTNVNVMNIVSNYFSINYGQFVRFIIDPSGQLFGNTPCGLNNFTHYMVYNPPSYSDEIIITRDIETPEEKQAESALYNSQSRTITFQTAPTTRSTYEGVSVPSFTLPLWVASNNSVTINNISGVGILILSPNNVLMYNTTYSSSSGTDSFFLINNQQAIFTYTYNAQGVCTILASLT
jgi:hypothetical protein